MYNGIVEVTVLVMMSGGDVKVKPFLSSRNILGNGEKPRTQNLKYQMSNGGVGHAVVVSEMAIRKWWWWLMKKQPSLSS